MQFDICMFDNDPALLVAPAAGGIGPQPDSLNIRRVRIAYSTAPCMKSFDWVIQFDLNNFVSVPTPNVQAPGSTNPAFNEMYLNWSQLPYVGNFRVGNFKEPIGFEHMESDVYFAVHGAFVSARFCVWSVQWRLYAWLGFLQLDFADQQPLGAIGFFGNNDDNFGYSLGNDYALTGRLTWCPYYDEPTDGRYVLHFGVAGSTRGADENLVRSARSRRCTQRSARSVESNLRRHGQYQSHEPGNRRL